MDYKDYIKVVAYTGFITAGLFLIKDYGIVGLALYLSPIMYEGGLDGKAK